MHLPYAQNVFYYLHLGSRRDLLTIAIGPLRPKFTQKAICSLDIYVHTGLAIERVLASVKNTNFLKDLHPLDESGVKQ